jgi:hypothetical protein
MRRGLISHRENEIPLSDGAQPWARHYAEIQDSGHASKHVCSQSTLDAYLLLGSIKDTF